MSDRPIVLSLTKMHEAGMSVLRAETTLRMASGTTPAILQREIVGADGLIIRTGGVVDDALMAKGDRLKVVGRHGVGYDAIEIEAATARGIQVVYTPGANTQSVVEHVFAMMISLSKHFPRVTKALEAGDYACRTRWVGREIHGKTLGIIGFGRIGRRVGEVAHSAFGMKVVYHDIVSAPPEVEAKAGATQLPFEEVLAMSDYVTLHVPLDETTRRMIARDTLLKMKSDAILINACRGPVVDEAAVAEALDAGRLWGYGADVFEFEPPPQGHPLIGRTDCLLTPHSAAQTEEGLRNMASGVVADVLGVLRGEAPRNPVNDPHEVADRRKRLGLVPLGTFEP